MACDFRFPLDREGRASEIGGERRVRACPPEAFVRVSRGCWPFVVHSTALAAAAGRSQSHLSRDTSLRRPPARIAADAEVDNGLGAQVAVPGSEEVRCRKVVPTRRVEDPDVSNLWLDRVPPGS